MFTELYPLNFIRRVMHPVIILLTGLCLLHPHEMGMYLNSHPVIASYQWMLGDGESVRSIVSNALIIYAVIYLAFELTLFGIELFYGSFVIVIGSVFMLGKLIYRILVRKYFQTS